MFNTNALSAEQQALIVGLVELNQQLGVTPSQAFDFMHLDQGSIVRGAGTAGQGIRTDRNDLRVLVRAGLIIETPTSRNESQVRIIPQGIAYYEQVKQHNK